MKYQGEWKSADEPPRDDATVLIGFADGSAECGFHAAGKWCNFEGLEFEEAPCFWTAIPDVPEVQS